MLSVFLPYAKSYFYLPLYKEGGQEYQLKNLKSSLAEM